MTRTGAVLGTLAYMAPEQLRGQGTSAQSDQFSFFVAFHEALYDCLPFKGDTPYRLQAAMDRPLPALEAGPRRVPRWLRRLIQQGLQREPEARHSGMQCIVDALAAGLKPRSWGWPAAGGLLVLSAVGFALLARGSDDPCRGLGTLDGWDLSSRAAVRAGFLASDIEGADLAWQRFDASAERFARAWGELKVDTCDIRRPGDGRPGADPELARRRDTCLTDGAALLGTFLQRYRQARPTDVLYSENAAFELHEALHRCTNDALLLRGDDPQAVSEGAALTDSLRDGLADALVLEIGGDLESARVLAANVLKAATDANARGLAAHAAFRLGRILSLLRRDTEAIDQLSHAFSTANEIGRDDIAAESVIELIKVLALDTEDMSRATPYDQIVESFVTRIGGTSQRRSAAAAEARGILALAQGRREDAILQHRKALELRRNAPETPTGDRIRSLVNLANALTEPVHTAAALSEARGLYEQAITSAVTLGEAHPLTADARRAYAIFLDEQGEYAAAQREAEASLSALRKVYGDPSRQTSVLHVLLGKLALETPGDDGDRRGAETHVEAALKFFEAAYRPGLVDSDHISALHLLAEIRRSAGDLGGALTAYERALQVLRPSGDHRERYAETLGYLGELLVEQGRPSEALSKLREAWMLLTLISAKREPNHAFLLAAMAAAEAQTGTFQRARATASEAEVIARDLGLDAEPEIRARLDPILNAPEPRKKHESERQ